MYDAAKWLGHNDWTFNQKFTTLSPACAVNAGTLIEVYCQTKPHDVCCGLCNYTNISGLAQVVWQFVTALLISSTIVLNPGEAWGVIVLQMLLITSQYIGIWGPMYWYDGIISHWEAYMQFPLSMGCLPVIVALLFSPIWKQGGRNVASLYALKARADAHQAVYSRSARNPPSNRVRRSFFLFRSKPDYGMRTQERRGIGDLMLRHVERPMSVRFWAISLAIVWLVDICIMLWFYSTHVWSEAEGVTWGQTQCDSQAKSNEDGLKNFSIAMVAVLFVSSVWQILGTFYPPWTAAELVASLFRRRSREEGRRKRGVSDGGYRVEHPWRIQTAATILAYCAWAAPTGYYFLDAIGLDGFVLIGDDPWTFGQVEMFVILAPHLLAFTRAIRARLVNNRADRAFASGSAQARTEAIADLLVYEGARTARVHDELDDPYELHEDDHFARLASHEGPAGTSQKEDGSRFAHS